MRDAQGQRVMQGRPNILYVFTDQQTATAMSCAGNPDIHTPNMDRLAARGVRFSNTYCTFPLCVPSRMSMWTGHMPSEMGIRGNSGTIPTSLREREAGRLLRDEGYRCGYAGKWHAGGPIYLPDPAEDDHGFEFVSGFDDNALPQACSDFIGAPEQPFFLVASFDNPHNICEHSRDELLPWGEIADVPPSKHPDLPANHAESEREPQAVRLYKRYTPKVQMFGEYDAARWRKRRHTYFRLVEKVDAQLGAILDALERADIADNTVVIFSGDHGDMNGAHGLAQKTTLYQEAVKVPLIIMDPRLSVTGRVESALVCNGLDLLPTLCDYAGTPAPEGLRGRSLRPFVDGAPVSGWRNSLVVETTLEAEPSVGATGRLVRTPRYAYHVYDWGQHREQLFDLEADPGETINLAGDQQHAATLDQHRRILADWCRTIGDRFAQHYSHPGCAAIPGIGFVRVENAFEV